jgi:hypothetical protein
VGSFVWGLDSTTIYFTAENAGGVPIYSVHTFLTPVMDKGKPWYRVTKIISGTNDNLATTPNGKALVFTRMSVGSHNEIYASVGDLERNWCDPAGMDQFCVEVHPLTRINQSVLSQVSM